MYNVRLIREVIEPGGSGPLNGQYALQKALRRRISDGLDWLRIGGVPRAHELPWFWCWADRTAAVRWARRGRPFIQGPNTLFLDSRRPRIDAWERFLLDTARCRLMFTESDWYRQLILRHRGPENRAPVVLWPYPIDPWPQGPAPQAEYDLCIYVKNGWFPGLLEELQLLCARCRVIHYGHYRREQLWDVARRSRCCCYLADDDRGPLALAEILLCGCPVVGVPTGAPFVESGRTGILLEEFCIDRLLEAIRICQGLDRREVAAAAARQFDTQRIVDILVRALAEASGRGTG